MPENFLKLHSVDLEVWSKLAECAHIKHPASKCAPDFDCDWERVNAFPLCVTLRRFLLPQIISYSDTTVLVLVVMEFKRASVLYVYEMIFLLHTSKVNRVYITKLSQDFLTFLTSYTSFLIIATYNYTICPLSIYIPETHSPPQLWRDPLLYQGSKVVTRPCHHTLPGPLVIWCLLGRSSQTHSSHHPCLNFFLKATLKNFHNILQK